MTAALRQKKFPTQLAPGSLYPLRFQAFLLVAAPPLVSPPCEAFFNNTFALPPCRFTKWMSLEGESPLQGPSIDSGGCRVAQFEESLTSPSETFLQAGRRCVCGVLCRFSDRRPYSQRDSDVSAPAYCCGKPVSF